MTSTQNFQRKVDLTCTLAGGRICLSSCLYNASGPRSGTAAALEKVAASESGAVLSKSATLLSQKGNPLPRTYHMENGEASFNSEGLPNSGIDYYISDDTVKTAMSAHDDTTTPAKPYIVSLSGKSLAENLEMLKRIAKKCEDKPCRISAIELNLACPNVIGKPIIGYDFQQMDDILTAITKLTLVLPPLGVKLPPYLDFCHFESATQVINRHSGLVKYVTAINTVGNALAVSIDSEEPVICSNSGFAGLSGPSVKHTGLANVHKLRQLLIADIDVVGVGGISTGRDLFEYILCGAAACQTATTHWKEGSSCFARILDELEELMQQKGYTSLDDIRGKLKPWSKEGAASARALRSNTSSSDASTAESVKSPDVIFFKALSVALAVVLVAILLGDVRFSGTLLPSEG